MKEHDIRTELRRILDSHDALLASAHEGRIEFERASTMQQLAFAARDAMLVNAIETNRAALRLLDRIMDEGVEHDT